MKTYIFLFMSLVALASTNSVFADTTVVEEVGVPITVDSNTNTYTVTTNPDYYYYSGHRCYVKERPDLGVNVLGLQAGVSGGTEIYCYPYP